MDFNKDNQNNPYSEPVNPEFAREETPKQRPYEQYQQNMGNSPPPSTPNQIPYIQNPNYNNPPSIPPVSLGEWLLSYLMLAIPCVNIVMLCIWAFSSNTNPSKQNWARAMFVVMIIGVVLGVVFFSAIMSMLANSYYYY